MQEETIETKVETNEENENTEEQEQPKKRYLYNYPLDEYFTHGFLKFFVVPEGFNVVQRRMGRYHTFPYGKTAGAGLRFILGLKGLWGDAAVVDIRLQTEEIPMINVITGGKIALPQVNATYNFQVIDVEKAMNKAEKYRVTTREVAESKIRSEIGSMTLEELTERKANQYNFIFDETNQKYSFPELDYIGVEMKGLYITQIKIPPAIETALAQQEIAIAEAEGEVVLAEKRVRIAELHAQAAQHYKDPEAQKLRDSIRYEDLIVHISQGDIVPWRYFGDTDPEYGCPGYGKCDPFGYRFAPNFQTNYVNQNNLKSPDSDLIAGYSDEDDQHKIRNTRNAMALVWSANDAFAKDDLKMHAEQTHAAMSTLPMGYTNNGPVYNGGLFGSNGIGTGYGRGQAHPTQVFAAAYATSRDDAWRATKKSIWFDRLVNDKLAKSQVPCSGIIGVNKNKNTQNEANAAAGNEMGMAANAMRSVLYRVYKNFDQTNAQTLQGVTNKHYNAFISDINDPSNPYSWKHSSSAPRVTIIVADENTPANVYCNWDDIPLQFQAYSNVGIATYEPQYAMAYGKLDTHDSNFDLALYGTVHANGGNGNTLLARLQDQSSGPGKIQGFGNSGIFALACAQRGQIDPSFCRYP